MEHQTSRITAVGHIASLVLGRNSEGRVMGTASRGIYLQPEGDLTLFLSREQFRGPLTINIAGLGGVLPALQSGDPVSFAADALGFPGHPLLLPIRQSLIWMPPQTSPFIQPTAALLETTASRARALVPGHPFLTLLDRFSSRAELPGEDAGFVTRLEPLYAAFQEQAPGEISSAMEGALGLGPGLTPLGDDLLLGILLAKHRGQGFSSPAFLAAAREKTSTLSWSLLTCAAQGSADERILAVLDGLTGPKPLADQDLINLLEWGSSSGIAVLAGMILALS